MDAAEILVTTAPDFALVEAARGGDPRALRRIHDEHRDRVRAYLYRLIGRDAELDDLAQIVFAKAFMSLGTFRGESKVSTWLYKIAINCARNHLRGRGRRMKMLGAFEIFARSCGGGAERRDPGAASEAILLLQQIRPDLREIFVLYHHEGLTLQEISEVTEAPISTVSDRLARARKELQRLANRRRPLPVSSDRRSEGALAPARGQG
jgi:RNA polymerase sigma-70 factor (ECF subfamily)